VAVAEAILSCTQTKGCSASMLSAQIHLQEQGLANSKATEDQERDKKNKQQMLITVMLLKQRLKMLLDTCCVH